jgi:hypothetical protein
MYPRTSAGSVCREISKMYQDVSNNNLLLTECLATRSTEPMMNRNQRRTVDYHKNEVQTLGAQTKDLKLANTYCDRIGQVIEQLEKDMNSYYNRMNDYNFESNPSGDPSASPLENNTGGMSASGYSVWLNDLQSMARNMFTYLGSQHLGRYSLLHRPRFGVDPDGPFVYKDILTYMTHASVSDRSAVPSTGFTADTDSTYWVVSNPDLTDQMTSLFEWMLVDSPDFITEWISPMEGAGEISESQLHNKLNEARDFILSLQAHQSINDTQNQTLEYMTDVTATNSDWHDKQVTDLTTVNADGLVVELGAGKQLEGELKQLYQDNFDTSRYLSNLRSKRFY